MPWFVVLVVLIQNSMEAVSRFAPNAPRVPQFTHSVLAAAKVAAVSPSLTAPATPSVGVLTYVPSWLPVSSEAVVPLASPSR